VNCCKYREFLGRSVYDSFLDEGFIYFLLPETVVDFLMLVEICIGLIVDLWTFTLECLRALQTQTRRETQLVGKDA
jgi:hypothetical protein